MTIESMDTLQFPSLSKLSKVRTQADIWSYGPWVKRRELQVKKENQLAVKNGT